MFERVSEDFERIGDLSHHVVTWRTDETWRGTVLAAHGFLDLAFSYQWFAEELTKHGYDVISWDFRGHGETEHIGPGGYYHFPDYVHDLRRLFDVLHTRGAFREKKPHLLGHSMGGTVTSMFAGLASSELASLTNIEGLGPPEFPYADTPGRFAQWMKDVSSKAAHGDIMPTREAVLARMRRQNPQLDDERGSFLAKKSTVPVPGGFQWRFDPLHRTRSPMPFRMEVFGSFLDQIDVPTLYVRASDGYRTPDESERLARIRDHSAVTLPGSHMVHWDSPTLLAEAWLDKFGQI